MTYIEHINRLIREKTAETGPLVVFGQNVAAGSCVGGVARRVTTEGDRLVINTPNAENTQVGVGLGLMLRGVSSLFVMKQQDFLLLGADQLVNTYNVLRRRPPNASFTILTVVVDSGYEGPQSCLNNFSDLCSLTRIPGYAVTNREDAVKVFDAHLIAPGFRIIGISQRLFRKELIEFDGPVASDEGAEIFRYAEGVDATVVAFNFALPEALELWRVLKEADFEASLFTVNAMLPGAWEVILADLARSQRLVVVDDSKGANRLSHRLLTEAASVCPPGNVISFHREFSDDWFTPNPDTFEVDAGKVFQRFGLSSQRRRRRAI